MSHSDSTNTLVHIAIDAVDAVTLPVLVEMTDDGTAAISLSVAMYARYLQREGLLSYESLRKYVAALGKLKDYYSLVHGGAAIEADELGWLLEKFLHAYDHGSVLGWPQASQNEYVLCRSAVMDYVKFVMDKSDGVWPTSEMQFVDACRTSWTSVKHAKQSLLFHTKKQLRKKTGGRKKILTGLRQYKQFPPKFIDSLLEETSNPRDRLLFSILAFGGRRVSEVLNAFTHDVFTKNEKLQFILAHPAHSKMSWTSLSGATQHGTRREYLKSQFNLLPRYDHGALTSALGWKGMKFDDASTNMSETYFIRDADTDLVTLHRTYLHQFRQRVRRRPHPYYWVNEDGKPLSKKAVEKQFSLAKGRVEKRHGVDLKGYGLHSLRHYYGFYCTDTINADLLMVQKWMGHSSLSSTAVYAHISPATAQKEMKAREIRKPGNPDAKAEPSSIEKFGTAAFGDIDTKRLTRAIK